eukprot:1155806-Rhodomonas_salina.1
MRDPRSGKDVVVGLVILGSEVPLHNGACGAEGRVSVFTRLLQYAQSSCVALAAAILAPAPL